MVLQKAQDAIGSLKGKPKEDKKVVAGGIAISVIVILLLGWGFFFIKKIQRGGEELRFGGSGQDKFNFSNVRQAQEDLMNTFSNEDELLEARQRANSGGQTSVSQDSYQEGNDAFGSPDAIE